MSGDETRPTGTPPAKAAPNHDEHARLPERSRAVWRAIRAWSFAAVPVVGLLELGVHLVQAHETVRDGDWKSARDYVAGASQPDDLVTFAPGWVDPIGREEFGPELATLPREARPDESRFPRAFEVSVHGGEDATLEGWRRTERHEFGSVTVTTLENPTPARVLDDLVSMVGPQRLQVSRLEGDHATDCAFARGAPQSGGLGAGPAIPGDRFACAGGGFVAASVAADLAYRPHRCIYAPPPGGRAVLRLRFLGVQLGRTLHGHHGLYVEAERDRKGAPVTITFKIGAATVGSVVHHDGDGWKPFEFDTTAFLDPGNPAHDRVDLVADIESTSGERRMYCFEADTR